MPNLKSTNGMVLWVVLLCCSPAPAVASDSPPDLISVADEVAKQVEQIRGWKFKRPVDKGVYSKEELRTFIENKIDKEYSPAEIRDSEQFLKTIGAIPKSTSLRETLTDILLDQIGGFYDPETQSFYMIDRGVDYGPIVDRIFIAHELTHALDDQYIDLDSLMSARERTEDGEFVTGALVEGSATALMTQYVTQAVQSGDIGVEDLTDIMKSEAAQGKKLQEAPPYFRMLLAHYACGMHFIVEGKLTAFLGTEQKDISGENFLRAVADPPTSSEQIIHPEKYWNPTTRDDPVILDDAVMKSVLQTLGIQVAATNTAGEALMAIVSSPPDRPFNAMASGMAAYWTNDAAMGWGGDRFYLLEVSGRSHSPKNIPAIWITVWDTTRDRDEFMETYESMVTNPDRRSFLPDDKTTVFLFNISADTARDLETGLKSVSYISNGGK